ncbi:hypothetical protein FHR76_002183 [Rhizobium sp. RAS22]|nr:hypothetical protein [Rhizobium sp. RAS22]
MEKYFIDNVENVFLAVSATAAIASVVYSMFSAIRAGAIKSVKFGGIQLEMRELTKNDVDTLQHPPSSDEKPFEVKALANYYNQALARANISFWFSLVFASIGFGVIIFAFISHTQGNIADTLIKVLSGTVIDGVSALFFVQSTNAQKSMSEFFEKLRLDRLNAEAREMISEIENVERRDQLRAQLVIKYAGIERLIIGQGAVT